MQYYCRKENAIIDEEKNIRCNSPGDDNTKKIISAIIFILKLTPSNSFDIYISEYPDMGSLTNL